MKLSHRSCGIFTTVALTFCRKYTALDRFTNEYPVLHTAMEREAEL